LGSAIVIGGLNVDTTMFVSALPKQGETIFGSGVATDIGGKGLNQALALHRAGARVHLAGAVGGDAEGVMICQFLEEQGIGVDHIAKLDGADSGRALITVGDDGENTIVVIPGANAQLGEEHVEALVEATDASLMVANLEAPLPVVARAFEAAQVRDIRTVLNPSPMQAGMDRLLAATDIVVLNEEEATALAGPVPEKGEPADLAQHLRTLGPDAVVLTVGGKGCYYADGATSFHVPALAVDVVDTTAAGDTFLGYFAAGLVHNMLPEAACAIATKAAGLCVQKAGASGSIPTRSEVDTSDS
jgi:ribokinase